MNPLGFILGAVGFFIGMAYRIEIAILSGVVGFLAGALINLTRKVSSLEKEFKRLRLGIVSEKTALPEAKEKKSATAEPLEPEAPLFTKDEKEVEETVAYSEEKKDDSTEDKTAPPPLPPSMDKRPLRTEAPVEDNRYVKYVKDFFLKGNVVARVGLIVLFFGIAYLLKYATEMGMFPIGARYISASVFALVLLGVGWKLRISHRNYGLLLQGGAVGLLYIIVFTAAKLFGLIPLSLAFGLMVLIVFFSGVLSILQNARSTAWFGAAGGFLAPILVSTGSGNHVALFSYYAILNGGILFIAFKKAWRELNLLSFYFTFGIATFWGVRSYSAEHLLSSEFFLILNFLFFFAISILFAYRKPPKLKGYVDGTLVFGLPIVVFSIQTALFKDIEYGLAISALCFGAFYIIAAKVMWKKKIEGMRTLNEAFLALGIVFLSLAVPLAVDGKWTAAAWALEGAALIWVGIRQDRTLPRVSGLILQAGSGLSFVYETSRVTISALKMYTPVINGFYLCCVILAFAGFFSGYYLFKNGEKLKKWEVNHHILLFCWGLLWWVVPGFIEMYLYVDSVFLPAGSLLFITFTVVALERLYRVLNWRNLIWPFYSMIPVFFIYFLTIAGHFEVTHPFEYFGFISIPVFLAGFYFTLFKLEDVTVKEAVTFMHLSGLFIITAVTTWELYYQLRSIFSLYEIWYQIVIGIVPALFAAVILAKGDLIKWPVKKHINDYKVWGTIIPLVFAGLYCLISGFALEGNPYPIPYIPLLNPLEMSQVFIILVSVYAVFNYSKIGIKLPDGVTFKHLYFSIGGMLFLVLNTIIARSIHFYAYVPFDWNDLLSSMVYHLCLSIFWTILSLILTFTATKKENRQLWITGIVLLGVVVVKLFFVDFAASQTGIKIISGIAVGVLMLIIGFFAPVPPKEKEIIEK